MNVVAEVLRQLGAADGVLYLVSRTIDRLSGGRCRLIKYHLVAQPVSATPLVPARSSGVMDVIQVDARHPLARRFPRPPDIIAARYAQGAVCFAAVHEGELAGFLWLVHDRYDDAEVRCRFVPVPSGTAVWDFDVYLEPRYRLGRGFARLWQGAHQYLRAGGVRWSISHISAFNAESLRSHQRLGAVKVGWAVFATAGAVQLMLCSHMPRVHFALTRTTHPTVAVRAPR